MVKMKVRMTEEEEKTYSKANAKEGTVLDEAFRLLPSLMKVRAGTNDVC